jgi:nucleoside-diphosphate-sugar epimerase
MNRDDLILVTGGCGYVGSRLIPRLLDLGMRIRVLDTQWFGNYLGSRKNLEILVGDVRSVDDDCLKGVQKVIHLANIANDPGVELNPSLSWEVNALDR